MMLQLHKQKNGNSSIWDQIKILSDDKNKLQQITNEIVEKTQIEEEFGDRKVDLEHSTIQDRINAKELAESLKEESEEDKRLREIEAIRCVVCFALLYIVCAALRVLNVYKIGMAAFHLFSGSGRQTH